MSDDIVRKHLYGDTEALGDKWVEAKKEAAKHKGTPQQTRYDMAAELARLAFDMATIIQREEANSEMLTRYMNMLADLMQRMTILEGAYAHFALSSALGAKEHLA